MSAGVRTWERAGAGYLDELCDDNGTPPHGDECAVCRLFSSQRPGETRAAWLARIGQGAVQGEGS